MRVLISLALVSWVISAVQPARAGDTDPVRKCFSAKLWSANDKKRPCVRILRVYEDGSSRIRVETAAGRELHTRGVGVPW